MTTPEPGPDRLDLMGLAPAELLALVQECGGRPVHGWTLLRALHREGLPDPAAIRPHLGARCLARLATRAYVGRPVVAGEFPSQDGSVRYLLRLADGAAVEAVTIPDEGRTTLCISSQVGCALRCSFCRTGTLGWQRNLTAGELTAQVALLRRPVEAAGRELTNVVFMGMGEPLANYLAVRAALAVLIHDRGGGLAARRVTVSTVGLPAGIRQLAADFGGRVSLAVSLTGTTDPDRDRYQPINRQFPLAELLQACRAYPVPRHRYLAFEVVLLGGETDREEDAHRLTALLAGLPVKVNLIPFNPFPGCRHRAPGEAELDRFFRLLNQAGLRTLIRQPRGREVGASCGLLAARDQGDAAPSLDPA